MNRRYIFRISTVIGVLLAVLLSALVISDLVITRRAKGLLYEHVDKLPVRKAGLLLGTSKYRRRGELNPYFIYRMDAAIALYKKGKIRYIIASGDNRQKYYNEPKKMRTYLVKRGIPSRAIYLDFAGFRTLDSVVRCERIFGQKSFTVISQKFHNERALFIARHFGIDAIGFNARTVAVPASINTRIREVFARAKAFVDLYLTGKQPHFLGEKIDLPE